MVGEAACFFVVRQSSQIGIGAAKPQPNRNKHGVQSMAVWQQKLASVSVVMRNGMLPNVVVLLRARLATPLDGGGIAQSDSEYEMGTLQVDKWARVRHPRA